MISKALAKNWDGNEVGGLVVGATDGLLLA